MKNKTHQKRVAAIHDLSGFGKCSLTVALPILSAAGIETSAIPTAILSTHTGGISGYTYRDLTEDMRPVMKHWKSLDIKFDAIYTGFLGSFEQLDIVREFFDAFRQEDNLILVDPVMGDNGRPYRTCTPELRRRMSELAAAADIITPNITEAAMLLEESYPAAPLTRSEAKSMLLRLSHMGPKRVVITGAELAQGGLASLGYDGENGSFWYVPCEYIPVHYPGCGDIYASVLLGAELSGASLPIAMARAAAFTELCVKTTYSYGSDPRYGVMLESVLGSLLKNEVTGAFRAL